MAGAAALALAAAAMVHERDPPSVGGLADDLVPEDDARELGPSFSTLDPQSPHASTRTSPPPPSGSSTSRTSGRPVASIETARIGVS